MNNLFTTVPEELSGLESLTSLHIDKNQLKEIPDFVTKLPNLGFINASNNYLDFYSLEQLVKNFPLDKKDLWYYSQKEQEVKDKKVTLTTGEKFELSAFRKGSKNTYQWYKAAFFERTSNGVTIQHYEKVENGKNATLTFDSVTKEDEAFYYCEIKNEDFPDLEVQSEATKIEIIEE